ncbi:MAG: oxidoreductase [Sphingobacteriales bacterium 50-39]|nr:Gfo/Idh/MocA family oxidoreductase [Sphingobacteriales bacterium]OJW61182.1 MAG: oxidoreductase [Sphingobacteriales bacterium 50-39]
MIPIKTALLSFGMSGRVFHAPFLHLNPGFELYAIWEREKNLSRTLYPNVRVYRSFEEILNDPAIELVVVNTPNYTHYEFTKAVLRAGKHAVVEKPFTVTVDEGLELESLAMAVGKKIAVYQSRRYDSDSKTVRKVVEEGWLGEIVEAELHYDRYTVALSPKVHKETPGPGRGLLYDLGSHLLDQVLQLWGMPEAVYADIGIIRPISKVDDYMELLLYYPAHRNLRVRLKSSYLVREPIPAVGLYGTLGTFLKPKADPQEQRLLAGAMPEGDDWGVEPDSGKGLLHTEKDGKVIREYIPSQRGNYGEFYDSLFEAIRNNKPVPVTAEEGIDIIRVVTAAYKSNELKKLVPIE